MNEWDLRVCRKDDEEVDLVNCRLSVAGKEKEEKKKMNERIVNGVRI